MNIYINTIHASFGLLKIRSTFYLLIYKRCFKLNSENTHYGSQMCEVFVCTVYTFYYPDETTLITARMR